MDFQKLCVSFLHNKQYFGIAHSHPRDVLVWTCLISLSGIDVMMIVVKTLILVFWIFFRKWLYRIYKHLTTKCSISKNNLGSVTDPSIDTSIVSWQLCNRFSFWTIREVKKEWSKEIFRFSFMCFFRCPFRRPRMCSPATHLSFCYGLYLIFEYFLLFLP